MPPHVPHGTRAALHADELRELAIDLSQACLDVVGIFDPTPISDGASALISLGRGQWLDAALSGASIIPYVGDLAKAGKFPKYLKTVERAIALASESAEAARLLTPVLQKLDDALRLLPEGNTWLTAIRGKLARFLTEQRALRAARHALPDISGTFRFAEYGRGPYQYKEAAGRLGVPGKVQTHRSQSAQRGVSAGTGDDAGHLIGNRFGAPGDARNLAQQNWISNRYGTFKDLENEWAAKLQSGTGIEVVVQDVFHGKYGDRAFKRRVRWTETSPTGVKTEHELIFANPHTPRSRDAMGIEPDIAEPQLDNVIDFDFVNRRRL